MTARRGAAGLAAPGPGGRDRGQATAELALVLPVVALLVLLVAQVAVTVRDQLVVIHAAREGARAAAVDDRHRERAARRAVQEVASLPTERTRVDTRTTPAGLVEVTVTYRAPTDVPVIGVLLGDVTLRSTAVMRREP